MSNIGSVLLTATALSLASTAASAATIYTDRSAWLAAVSGVTTDNFEENGPGGFTSYDSAYNGAGFSVTSTSDIFTVDPAFNAIYNWGSGDVLDVEFGIVTITAGSAFGFDFGSPDDFFPETVTIDGKVYDLIGQPEFNFFGVVGAVGPIVINWNGGLGIIDNFSVATPAIPEPAALGLLGLGLGLIALRRRKAV